MAMTVHFLQENLRYLPHKVHGNANSSKKIEVKFSTCKVVRHLVIQILVSKSGRMLDTTPIQQNKLLKVL